MHKGYNNYKIVGVYMKKNIKLFIGILIGLIFGIGATVTASVIYNSSEIGFTPSDTNWKVNNLQDAVNDLYSGVGIESITSESINEHSGAVNTISINPSGYKAFVVTNMWYGGSNNYPSYLDTRLAITSITNATYIDIGKTGHGSSSASGVVRSYLIVPDNSGQTITINFAGLFDAHSVYGLK